MLALVFAVTGCGSDANDPGAAGPSGPSGPSGSANGVTIQGTVLDGGTAAASSEVSALGGGPKANLKVTVESTNLSTTTNGRGEFIISGAPSGNIVLHFQGSGVDARLEIKGLTNGQTITITAHVSGNKASLENSRAELRGKIESIALPSTLMVDGTKVTVPATVRIQLNNGAVSFTELRVGDTIRIQGAFQPDGSLLASDIRLEGKAGGDGPQAKVEGSIASIAAPDFVAGGKTLHTDSRTKFHGKGGVRTLSDLKVGDKVEVTGRTQPDGHVYAESVKKV